MKPPDATEDRRGNGAIHSVGIASRRPDRSRGAEWIMKLWSEAFLWRP